MGCVHRQRQFLGHGDHDRDRHRIVLRRNSQLAHECENPAIPGELIYVYATGLGTPTLNDGNKDLIQTGYKYPADGPVTTPASFMNSIAGGKTADVITATLMPGTVGVYQVLLHLNPDLPTDTFSQLTIAQDIYREQYRHAADCEPTGTAQ